MAAGRELSRKVTFSMLSKSKTEKLLGRSVDISQAGDESYDVNGENRRMDDDDHMYQQRQLLLKQAASFLDFERLFAALDAIEEWREVAAQSYE